jgi:HlyD family secretion protein
MAGRSKILMFGLPVVAAVGIGTATLTIPGNIPKRALTAPAVLPPTQPRATAITTDTGAEPQEVRRFIGAAGILEPSSEEISIGTQLPGIVDKVRVVAGTKVALGAPLFDLDDRIYRSALTQAEAAMAVAEADLAVNAKTIDQQLATVEQSRATLAASQAERVRAQRDKERADTLMLKGIVTVQRLDSSTADAAKGVANERSSQAALLSSEKQVAVLRATGAQLQAKIAQAKAQVERAKIDLTNTTLLSPIDGTVLQVRVRPGQVVESRILDNSLMAIGKLDPMHVRVDIDEVDITRFRPGLKAYVSTRGLASRRIEATFVRTEPLVTAKKSLTGASTERVDTRVLQVIYSISGTNADMFPGQQVDVYIETAAVAAGLKEHQPKLSK